MRRDIYVLIGTCYSTMTARIGRMCQSSDIECQPRNYK